MPKLLIEDVEHLRVEMARVGALVFSKYNMPAGQLTYWTIEDALASQAQLIQVAPPYPDLTRWELLEQGEFLMVYDIERKIGRALNDRDLEYLGGDGTSLTPSGMRRWFLNRKSDDEYLVSDGNGLNIWRP